MRPQFRQRLTVLGPQSMHTVWWGKPRACQVFHSGDKRTLEKYIYNSEHYVWRSDSVVGGKIPVVYGRAVRNRNVENFILRFSDLRSLILPH